jgi:hypothetical protein
LVCKGGVGGRKRHAKRRLETKKLSERIASTFASPKGASDDTEQVPDLLGLSRAWNRAAVTVFGDYERLHGDERYIMHMLFANSDHRKLLVDWEHVARSSLAKRTP